jgi:hypothetical protein
VGTLEVELESGSTDNRLKADWSLQSFGFALKNSQNQAVFHNVSFGSGFAVFAHSVTTAVRSLTDPELGEPSRGVTLAEWDSASNFKADPNLESFVFALKADKKAEGIACFSSSIPVLRRTTPT